MNKIEDLDIDTLLGIASRDGVDVSNLIGDTSNVADFLREYKVKDGDALVPNYKVYNDYCNEWKPAGQKLSKIGFLRKLSRVFKSKRDRGTRYYLLNKEAFSLDKDSLDEAKRFDKRYRNKIKSKQKIKGEVSSNPEEVQS